MRAGNIILEKAKSKFRIHRPGTQQNTQENHSKNKAKANSNRCKNKANANSNCSKNKAKTNNCSKQQPCCVYTTWLLHIRFVSPL